MAFMVYYNIIYLFCSPIYGNCGIYYCFIVAGNTYIINNRAFFTILDDSRFFIGNEDQRAKYIECTAGV